LFAVTLTRAADDAKQIAAVTGFRGGLVVHVGCGDGKLTAALHLADNCVVQGLDADVTAARKHIQSLGLYGPVSVMRWSGQKLPYVDNLVTLVVCEDSKAVSKDEIMRVLRPLGAMATRQNGKWTATIKPWPKDIDEWQQHYHGADNNSVAQDTVSGPPRRYQWLGFPEWQRSHLAMPSINSLVSSKGRLFTVEDIGSAEHPALPGKFAIVARDAYNGIVLWRVMFPDWHPIYIRDKETPVQLQRRIAAIGDVVYCTPGYSAPITAFDAATGAVQRKYDGTANSQEFVHDRGVLFTVTGDQYDVSEALNETGRTALKTSMFKPSAYGPIIKKPDNPKNDIIAVDAATGRELWRRSGDDTKGYEGASLGVSGDRVVYSTEKELVCLDRASGKPLWRVSAPVTLKGPNGIAVSLVLSDRAAFLADSQRLRAFRLADGKALWSQPATINHHKAPDVFLANGLVWTSSYDADKGKPAPALGLDKMGSNGFDPETGKLVKHLEQAMTGPMGHDRCYRNRITTSYYINSATGGSDFLGFTSPAEYPNPWIRSTCGVGFLPCNGLFYAGPPSCACCNSVMLNALNAFATELGRIDVQAKPSLEKGPAYSEASQVSSSPDDWPTYRYNAERTGSTKTKTSATLAKRWDVKLGSRVSAPVIAGGKVFVADVDGHAVCAVNAADGKLAWRFTAEGRVDSPPTFHQGLLLFGSRDGTVYCVRASDGALAWRFTPLERRLICAYGQTESAWPVCGSVLVKNGLAYFAAGRNSFTDGGIFVFALDARTGKVVHQKRMYGPHDEKGFPIENREVVGGMSIEGFKSDVFLAAGDLLYLRHQGFNADLSPVKLSDVKEPHLIPSHGFLEAIPQHRSFWTIDIALRYDIPTGLGGIHGDILVMDGKRFYEVRGYQPGRTESFDPRAAGYTLYAGTYGGQGTADITRKGKKAKRAFTSKNATSTKLWSSSIPLTGKALALTGDTLFVAGTPVAFPENDLAKAYEGRMGGVLWAASASTGEKLAQYTLDAAPVWDSLAVANGALFVSLADGRVICMAPR
jgi:outer membrane protein assembly factor BamB